MAGPFPTIIWPKERDHLGVLGAPFTSCVDFSFLKRAPVPPLGSPSAPAGSTSTRRIRLDQITQEWE